MNLAAALLLAAASAGSGAPAAEAPRGAVRAGVQAGVAGRASVEVLRAERIGDAGGPLATYRQHRREAGGTLVIFH